MKPKTIEAWRTVVGGFGGAVAIMSGIAAYIMLKSLLTSWLIPVLCVLPVALALALPLRGVTRWLTGSYNTWLNISIHMLLMYPLLLGAVMLTNKLWVIDNQRDMQGVVDRVYTEKRKSTRRSGRRSYRTVEKLYNVINITLETGKSRKIDVSKKIYRQAEKGDTVQIPVTTGIFHMTQMEEGQLKLLHPHIKKSRRPYPDRSGFGVGAKRSKMTSDEIREYHRRRIDSIRNSFKH